MNAAQTPDDVRQLYSRLTLIFAEELERQENVLRICRAQGEAARVHDLKFLAARTQALEALMEEAKTAEVQRNELLQRLVSVIGLPVEQQTLTDLIRVTPEPWKRRMQEFQTGIREVLKKTQETVRENERFLRGSIGVVEETVQSLGGDPEPLCYSDSGRDERHGRVAPALINTRG